ncbi:uncharacterized protein K441DRAFT_655180 [Cenococcum geophilum 1.58]|uniref:uncharacterized protein n=1 Tax=Cenococcum geophilum 1.58 TaxID=794803 RepID=UPI00358E9D65|nr:hypothetical protein K441DRAFT_655180 [Cenococcum geophilum 1.58]
MAELGFQSLTPDDATIDSSNCDGRAGREKFLRGMTEEESGESDMDMFNAPLYSPAQPPNETPSNKSEMADSPGPPKQGAEEADLLSKMPALFDPKLPPVGPERQVAYERLVKLLRERWTLAKGERSAVELTRELRDELAYEVGRSLRLGRGMRTLWRRDAVFQFEIQWSEWFLEKATMEETGEGVDITEESPKEKPTLRTTNFAYHDGYDAWFYGDDGMSCVRLAEAPGF